MMLVMFGEDDIVGVSAGNPARKIDRPATSYPLFVAGERFSASLQSPDSALQRFSASSFLAQHVGSQETFHAPPASASNSLCKHLTPGFTMKPLT